MEPVKCHCRGDHCKHHARLELCPNDAVPPIAVMYDEGKPIANSEYGLCEACYENQMLADDEDDADKNG